MNVPFSPSARRRALARLLPGLSLLASPLCALPAFPGADGFGAGSAGGRGGSVYHVTNLNDSGTGSFRDAVSAANRTVVFDVGGIIRITSPVSVSSNITIAGQTAPGGGVTIYGNRVSFSGASNVIVRYLRFRQGINGDSGSDAVGAASGSDMIFDHVSASWGRDETFSLSGQIYRVTLQDCIIGQGLLVHSAGGLIQTDGGVSILRTLYADNWMRNPKVKGVNDFRNNVVYNWGSGGGYIPAGDSAGQTYANLIANYFIAGPSSPDDPFKTGNKNYHLYHEGNLQDTDRDGVLADAPVTDASFPTLDLIPAAHAHPAPAFQLSASEAYKHVLANAGASLYRDHADEYMVAEAASKGTAGALISSEAEIGGIGTLPTAAAATDTDRDGMPDWWEAAAGTDPLVADNNGDRDGNGYTNLEDFLNAIAPAGVRLVGIEGVQADTGASASDGITSDTAPILRGFAPAGSTVTLSRADTGALGTVVADADGRWTFEVANSSAPLADRYYAFSATATLGDGKVTTPSPAFVLKVDTVADTAPVISSIAMSPSLLLKGTATPGSAVSVFADGVLLSEVLVDSWGNWVLSYEGPALSAGAHAFTCQGIDRAGNIGALSSALVVNPAIPAPAFTGIATDSNIVGDAITNDGTLIFSGTAPANSTVSVLRVGVGVIGTATASASGAWSYNYTATTLPQGEHFFTASALVAGESSPASSPYRVLVDQTRPQLVTVKRLFPESAATTASTVVFRIQWAEPVTGVDASDWALTLAGTTGTISQLTQVDAQTQDVTVTGVSGDGTIRLDRKASGTGIKDIAGNEVTGAYTGGQSFSIRLPGSSVWTTDENNAAWGDAANWESGTIVNDVGLTADFAQRDVVGEQTVLLDAPRTAGRVIFGDADTESSGRWTLSDGGNSAAVLTLAGATPTIQVNAASTSSGDTVDVPAANAVPFLLRAGLDGTGGLTKTGVGTLAICQPAAISGPLTVTRGIVEIKEGGSYSPSSVYLATSQQLHITGGSFSTSGDVTWKSGTGTGILVSAGTANFQRIIPSNARNSWVKVTGGTMTATDISFLRSGDSEVQAIAAGVLISGGDSTVGSMGLGTGDSWGAMSISGGRMTVTGALVAGWQKTSTRGGVINVSGGELNCPDATAGSGLILARNPGGSNANVNNVAKLNLTGGVANIARLTLGFDSTSSAGSATVKLDGGTLRLGSGGIVRGGSGTFVSDVNLVSGTLGALADWSTTLPLTLAGTGTNVAIDVPTGLTVTLSGGLVGMGGFEKRGGGLLVLGGSGTFTGPVLISGGSVRLAGVSPFALTGSLDVAPGQVMTLVVDAPAGCKHGDLFTVATFASTNLEASSVKFLGAPAGMAFVPVVTGTSLSYQVVETPVVSQLVAPVGAYGHDYSFEVSASHDPERYSATGLPVGLTIDPLTGVISGTAYDVGDHVVQVFATNAAGTAESSVTISLTITATVRHAPTLNGGLDGSLLQLSAESVTLNGSAWVSGDLLVPGMPYVRLNGKPLFAGVIERDGAVGSSSYWVTLNGSAVLRNLVTRIDGVNTPVVAAPAACTGTRYVHLNKATDTAGDFATLRELTMNSGAGLVALPPGAYNAVTVNGGTLVLGGGGDGTQVEQYDIQRLTLNSGAHVVIAGPVLLRVASDLRVGGTTLVDGPGTLVLEFSSGGLSLDGDRELRALVVAPNGTITLNGRSVLRGRIIADRLVINGQALLSEQ